jgi:UrcA family protein
MPATLFKSTLAASLAFCAALAASLPAVAVAAEPERTETVRFAKADLATADGAAKVYRAILQAANSACNASADDTDVRMRGPGPCVSLAVAAAVRKLDSPSLSQVYVAKNGIDRAQEFGVMNQVLSAKN